MTPLNDDAVEFLTWLRRDGPWVLTAIKPDGPIETITARNADAIRKFVRANDGIRNLYFSVNPTRKAMTKKASKADIAAIEYLLADLDPKPDETSEAAKDRYLAALETFQPAPTAIINSGNGIQALWKLAEPIRLPDPVLTDDGRQQFPPEVRVLVADVEVRIAALMERLDGSAGTQNIDRILRLPGTTNLPNAKKLREGRVPCPAKLISCNGNGHPLAAFPPPAPNEATPTDGLYNAGQTEPKRAPADVDALPVSDRIKNLIRGVDDAEHVYASRSERVMAVLVAMAGAACTDEQMTAIIFDKALPIGEHVREQPKPGAYLTRQIKSARAKAGNSHGHRPDIKVTLQLDDVLKSAADLQNKTFEELRWIVPHYLPEGCSMLGGRPKIGKSWLALDLAIGVSTGSSCLGQQCEQGDVLALMLEDNDRRLQRRLTMMLGAQKEKWPERLTYATAWPYLNGGGLDWMQEWIGKVSKPRLIIVDILERVRQRTAKNDKQPQYSADYDALLALQTLSTEAQLSILVLHHQRKMEAEDLIDTLSGTLGLGGAVDAVLILGKDQFGKFLYGRGRDLEEFNISVKQDEQHLRWQVLGPRLDTQASPERAAIISALKRTGKPMTVGEIAAAVGGNKNNVKELLSKLNYEGDVERVATGVYRLPNAQEDIPF